MTKIDKTPWWQRSMDWIQNKEKKNFLWISDIALWFKVQTVDLKVRGFVDAASSDNWYLN